MPKAKPQMSSAPAKTDTAGAPRKKLLRGSAEAKKPAHHRHGVVLDDKGQEQPADKSSARKSGRP